VLGRDLEMVRIALPQLLLAHPQHIPEDLGAR
jgi:hypothetical protein